MTDVLIDARRGAGSSLEILYGTVTWKPTLTHSRGTSIVLPAPTTYDLVDGQVVATNVQPSPDPVEGQVEWAYEVTFKDRHSKSYSFLVGVPDTTLQVNFIDLPRYFETKPPLFGQGPVGPAGEAATIEVGAVESGTTPSITNSGTNQDAILNFVLPKGDQGIQGPIGATGPIGEQGIQGPKGDKGDTGSTGAPGATGPKGDDGTSVTIKGSVATASNLPTTGNTVGDGWITDNDGHLHVWSGTAFSDVGEIRGPQGDPGDQGPAGDTGPQGEQGLRGLQGIQGPTGPQGPKGDGVTILDTTFDALPETYGNGTTIGSATVGAGWPVTGTSQTDRRSATRVIQTLVTTDGTRAMQRSSNGGVWSEFREFAWNTVATTTANGLMSSADKSKLDNVGALAYASKTPSNPPSTYPAGTTVGLMRVSDGWPTIPGNISGSVIVRTDKPLGYNSATQWVSGHKTSDASLNHTAAIMYREGATTGTWGEWAFLHGEEITPEKYGAVGDGVTDDTSAIQQAINEASSTGKPVTFGGLNYKATGSLLSLWDVVLEGTGNIVKNETSFPIAPLRNDTVTLYADGDRTASGDGLSWGSAIQTLGGIETRLRSLSALHLDRRIVVKLRGTFSDGHTFSSLPITPYPIRFEGEETEGDPVTKVIKGSSSFGMRFEPGGNVVIRKILFDGFAVGFNGYGALMKGLGRFKVEHCVAQNCDIGFAAINNVNFTITDTIARNCNSNGFRIQYSSSGLWARCSAINNGNSGFFASRNAVAHLDYCTADGNGINGLIVDMSARVACIANNFKNNGNYGVRTEGSGEWLRDDSTGGPNNFFVDTPEANGYGPFAQFGVSRETRLYSISATNEFKVFGSYETKALTGNTSNNAILITPSGQGLPIDFFRSPGQKVRVKMWGRFVGGAGAKTISLSTTGLSGNNINHIHTREFAGGGGNAAWCMETDLYANNPALSVMEGLGTSFRGGETPRLVTIYKGSELVNGVRFRVYGQLSDGSDSIELHGFELYVSG